MFGCGSQSADSEELSRKRRSILAVAALALGLFAGWLHPAAAEDCKSLIDQFNRTVEAGLDTDAQALGDRIATSAGCGGYQGPAQKGQSALRLSGGRATERQRGWAERGRHTT